MVFFLHGNFCLNTAFTFLESQCSKLKAFCACVGDIRWMVRGPLSLTSYSVSPSNVLVSVVAIWMVSNCWLLVFERSCSPWIVAHCQKVHEIVILSLWKNSSTWIYARICFALANVAKPVLQGTQACIICTQRNTKWHIPSPWYTAMFTSAKWPRPFLVCG